MKLGLKAFLLAVIIAATSAFNAVAPASDTGRAVTAGTVQTASVSSPASVSAERPVSPEAPGIPGSQSASQSAQSPESPAAAADPEGFTLNKVVVLSRHNIRSPLSEKGSLISELTPHDWFNWTSATGELSLRGAMLETTMGQYFRLRLEQEGLFPESFRPADGEVRFYANGFQRTQATARYFSAGLLPVADVPIECRNGYNEADDTFLPKLNFTSEKYAADVAAELAEMGAAKGRGSEGLEGYRESLEDALRLIIEVTDMEETEAYRSGEYGDLLKDSTEMTLEAGSEPSMKGAIRTAVSFADALILQYYEEPDDLRAAFGHDLTEADWLKIGTVLSTYEEILFTAPLLAVNLAHPMLQELRAELAAPERKFSFLCGHDSTVTSVLAALGTEAYTLPGAVEPTTPIGVKLVFEQWLDEDGAAFYTAELVYQSTEQLRAITPLSLETPPMIVPIRFAGARTTADGLIPEAELLRLFDSAIEAYYDLEDAYTEDALAA